MDNWEYTVLVLPATESREGQNDDRQIEFLNTLGNKGWELISVTGQIVNNDNCQKAYFKRRKDIGNTLTSS